MAVTLRERPVLRGEDAQRFIAQEKTISTKYDNVTPVSIRNISPQVKINDKVCLKA